MPRSTSTAQSGRNEHDAPEWQAAIWALMLAVEHDGQTLLARIGMMRALYPPVETTPVLCKTKQGCSHLT